MFCHSFIYLCIYLFWLYSVIQQLIVISEVINGWLKKKKRDKGNDNLYEINYVLMGKLGGWFSLT